jgi:DNA invertase Pin-like site-specific DNA recombinase
MATKAAILRVGIYTRISSDDDTVKGLGVARQEKHCRAFATVQGWKVTEVYCDNDRSASNGKPRPEFDRLVADQVAGKFDRILVYSQERLVRDALEREQLIKLFDQHNIPSFETCKGPVDLDTAQGQLIFRVTGAFDSHYPKYLTQLVINKKAELAESGAYGGGTRPFGYRVVNKQLRIDESEADLVREAAQRLIDGESLGLVCREWNEAGVRTPRGNPWRVGSLREMLIGPRVAGLRQHRGEIIGDAAAPALLDRETWNELRAVFSQHTGRNDARAKLLTGLLVCGKCGAKMNARNNNEQPAYGCRGNLDRPGSCGRVSIKATEVEQFVQEAFFGQYRDRRLAEALTHPDASEDERIVAEGEAEQLELTKLYKEKRISRAEWLALRDGFQADIDAARARLYGADNARLLTEVAGELAEGGPLEAAWPSYPLAKQRRILGVFVDRIVVDPAVRGRNRFDADRIHITWRI